MTTTTLIKSLLKVESFIHRIQFSVQKMKMKRKIEMTLFDNLYSIKKKELTKVVDVLSDALQKSLCGSKYSKMRKRTEH